jgi:PPOX class probable F420-dependent enzyme
MSNSERHHGGNEMSTTVPDSHADLLDAPQATLATVGPDGRPQMSSVWFLAEDGVVRFSLHSNRQKTKNLQANPVIGVHIQDSENPVRYLEVRGDARIEPDDDYEFATRLGAKYGGADLRAMDAGQGQRFVVTVEPVRVNAIDLSAG